MPTITAHLTPADKTSTDYCYVPFDVPAGISRLDVHYAYSHPRHHADFEGEGNTLDLGLFDPRGHEFLKAEGFRGWSGSDRSHIWVGESTAETAPGYLAGPIHEGRWHVILGLYRIAPEGCDYSVTIELTPRAHDSQVPVGGRPHVFGTAVRESGVLLPAGARPSPFGFGGFTAGLSPERPKGIVARAAVRNPEGVVPAGSAQGQITHQARGAGWYRGDLQSHTHHSDAKGSLSTLVATSHARGLDFLAVTDHNTVSQFREFGIAPAELLLIPAIELTTYYGHMNVWGVRDWVDFRCRDAHALRQIIAAVHRQGGLASVNHPKTGGPPWEYGGDLDFDCIEVWQAPWPFYNTESFAWWESLLKQGRHVVAVGGSDYHQPETVMAGNPHLPGHPTTWVYASECSVAGILAGIRQGHIFISADVNGPRLYFTASRSSAPFGVGCETAGLSPSGPKGLDFRIAVHTAESRKPASDGRHTYQAGDVAGPAPDLELTIRVQDGTGFFARLVADGDVIAELPIDMADWTHTWPPQPPAAQYLRAEVIIRHGPSDWVMAACTNPIYC